MLGVPVDLEVGSFKGGSFTEDRCFYIFKRFVGEEVVVRAQLTCSFLLCHSQTHIMVNTKNFIASGCICCYGSCEIENILIGCAGAGECLCLQEKCCLGIPNEKNPMFPVGMVKEDGMICKISLPCCQCGIKKPTVLVSSAGQCLCIKQAAAFPFADPVPHAVCALCCFTCVGAEAPGCMVPYKGGGAPAAVEITR
jgi:hypothetical protein